MAILKNTLRSSFTQLPNEAITDMSISNTAYRVLSYLFSKPDGWQVNNSDIMKTFEFKKDAMSSVWKSLIKAGWIARTNRRDAKGRMIGGFDYELMLSPKAVLDDIGDKSTFGQNPQSAKTHNPPKPLHSNTDSYSNTNISNNTNSYTLSENEFENNFFPIDDAQASIPKRKKVAPKKEKVIIPDYTPTENFGCVAEFDTSDFCEFEKWFFSTYKKSVKVQKARQAIAFLSDEQKQVIINHLPLYAQSTQPKYRENPANYLNNKTYYDEIIIEQPRQKSTYAKPDNGNSKTQKEEFEEALTKTMEKIVNRNSRFDVNF